jgi:DNA-binding PadR family transcriptional regulator
MVSRVATLVLGLLAEGERHGYDLIREMDERGMLRWTRASTVAVYKALSRLEGEGCLTSWTQKEGNLPEKRVYAITAAGEEKLRDLVYSICASHEPIRFETAIGLTFMHCLSPPEARDALEARLAYLKSEAGRLRRERDILEGLRDDIFIDILDREYSAYRAEIRWLTGIVNGMQPGGSAGKAGGAS